MDSKPERQAVALYALDQEGKFLAVKRSDDDDSLPGVWGLAAASLRNGEDYEDAVKRAASDKLGVEVEILKYDGEDTALRGDHTLRLREYQVAILSGVPSAANKDKTASHYAAIQWSSDPELLREAAIKGSLCSRIFLRNKGLLKE